MREKNSTSGRQPGSEVTMVDSEADPAQGGRTESGRESQVGVLTLRFAENIHNLAEALKEKAIEEAEQKAQATARLMLDSAKTEAEEIVQAATQRANHLDSTAEADARDLADGVKQQLSTFMAGIADLLSKPEDSGEGSEDDAAAPVGNPHSG